MNLTKVELMNLNGGSWSATMFNAFARTVNTIFDLGRSIGSSIRRIFTRSYC